MAFVTRFAPSPTGPLHLGHAYSALLAYDMAVAEGGKFLLRMEDIDQSRSKPKWTEQIYDDLQWLGIWWDAEPVCQFFQCASVWQIRGHPTLKAGECRSTDSTFFGCGADPQLGLATFGFNQR